MARATISTPQAPAAIGPYSQAVVRDDVVYTAGQVGIDPQTGKLVQGGIEAQTRQALSNLQAILEAAGTSMANVLKTTIFMQDLADFAAMNQVYAGFFSGDPPARSTTQAAALPLGALIEIDVVAAIE
jgi:2-iminobutanoate/2-iminopropanoate deaminase